MSRPLSEADEFQAEGVGWMFFAGTILGIAGIMRIFDGVWAFRYDGVVPDELEGAILGTSLTTYGWVWLIVGVVLIVSSFAVMMRSQFARWIGIIAGAVLAITASGGCRTTRCGHRRTSSSACSSCTASPLTAAALAPSRRSQIVLIALLIVLGIELIVIVAFWFGRRSPAVAQSATRRVCRSDSTDQRRCRRAPPEMGTRFWSLGRDVLVWNRAPFCFSPNSCRSINSRVKRRVPTRA